MLQRVVVPSLLGSGSHLGLPDPESEGTATL